MNRPSLLLLALSLALVSCVRDAREPDLEGRRISSLNIRYRGHKTVDEVRLGSFIASKEGTLYSEDRIDGDIKSLYESGLITDVRILAEPKGDAVEVIAEVTLCPPMGPPGFIGNTVFSDQKLAKETKLRPGQKASESAVKQACRNIENYYHRNGHPGVEVTTRWESDELIGPYVVFLVDEGIGSQP